MKLFLSLRQFLFTLSMSLGFFFYFTLLRFFFFYFILVNLTKCWYFPVHISCFCLCVSAINIQLSNYRSLNAFARDWTWPLSLELNRYHRVQGLKPRHHISLEMSGSKRICQLFFHIQQVHVKICLVFCVT